MPVPAPPAAEHHVTPGHRALVHLPQVDRAEVDLECSLVTEGLQTDVALDPLLAGGGVDEGRAEVLEHCIEMSVRERPPTGTAVRLSWSSVTAGLHLLATAQVHRIEDVLFFRLPLRRVVETSCSELMLIWRQSGVLDTKRRRNRITGHSGLMESHRAHRGRNWFLYWRPGDLGSSPLGLPVIKGMHAL